MTTIFKMTKEILRGATWREVVIGVLLAMASVVVPPIIIYLLVVYGGLK